MAAGRGPAAMPTPSGGLGVLDELLANRSWPRPSSSIAVPIVLVGYILLVEAILRRVPRRIGRPALRPWLWLAPALDVPRRLPRLSDDRHASSGASRTDAATTFVGLENYEWFFSQTDTLIALRNNVLWVDPAAAPGRRPRAAGRDPRRPRPLRGDRQVDHLPAAGDQLRGGRRHLAVHVRARPATSARSTPW